MKTTESGSEIIRREASTGFDLGLRELFKYRELLYFLTWRDVKIRYKQTILGGAWAVIQPMMTMIVFSIFFGKLAKIPSDGVPYPIFSFAALVPWTLFSNGLTKTSTSLVGNANLIRKVYFPRLVIPISGVLSGFVDFLIAFGVLLIMMLAYGIMPTWRFIFLPLLILLVLMTSLSTGFWFSALNVRYRDVRYIVPFLSQFWLYATPIAYPSSLLSEPWKTLYGLNPMVGVVEGFRWVLLGTNVSVGPIISVGISIVLLLFAGGVIYFRRMERTFADVV